MWQLENLKLHVVCILFWLDNAILESCSTYVPTISKMEIIYEGLLK